MSEVKRFIPCIAPCAASLALGLALGCRSVVSQPVGNIPAAGAADLKGMPAEAVRHFNEVYPPDRWPGKTRAKVVVGPIEISRQALLLLSDSDVTRARSQVATGADTAITLVENQAGDPRVLTLQQSSLEARALVLEALAAKNVFTLVELAQKPPVCFGDAREESRFFEDLMQQGVRYCLSGNLTGGDDKSAVLRLYLRVVDVNTRQMICATSGEGDNLRSVVGATSDKLISMIKP